MKIRQKLNLLKEQAKQNHIVLLISVIYNFIWAVSKIVFGAVFASYFFCVSGASTLIFGFIKKIYRNHLDCDDEATKQKKSTTIAILLMISSLLFCFYMARLFFTYETKEYGLIISITIALLSFCELFLSIFNFIKAKQTNDILLQSFRGCNISSSLFAISLTQVALLSATNSTSNFLNALTGVVSGILSFAIGLYLLVKSSYFKKDTYKKV